LGRIYPSVFLRHTSRPTTLALGNIGPLSRLANFLEVM
jgi:hypothetical protein